MKPKSTLRPAVQITGSGFILLILFGNFWVVERFLGQVPAPWIMGGLYVGLLGCAVGGLGMLWNWGKSRF